MGESAERENTRLLVILIVIGIAFLAAVVIIFGRAPVQEQEEPEPAAVSLSDIDVSTPRRVHYAYQWDDSDLQGDWSPEVAAGYILCQANHLTDDKEELAGYLDGAVSTDSRALSFSEVLNRAVAPTTKVAVPIVGSNLLFIPAPSIVWQSDGRPVVFLYADEATVTIADPASGVVTYPFSQFTGDYDGAGRQAVYLADRGYTAVEDIQGGES